MAHERCQFSKVKNKVLLIKNFPNYPRFIVIFRTQNEKSFYKMKFEKHLLITVAIELAISCKMDRFSGNRYSSALCLRTEIPLARVSSSISFKTISNKGKSS